MPITLTYIDTQNGKFYVRRKNDEGDQKRMIEDLDNFYFPLRHNDLKPEVVNIGDVVAVKVYRSQEWHRAQILHELDHSKLGPSYKVVLLDRVSSWGILTFHEYSVISGVKMSFRNV